jgi:beta-galactosidase
MAHILPHWNWPDRIGEVTPVHVYTSGDEAELFLNGNSMGRKRKEQYDYRLHWDDVRYQPGELAVVAYKDGKPWAESTVQTTGRPASIRLEPDRKKINADARDLCFVTVEVVDDKGRVVPDVDLPVAFSLEGSGKIIATGNGDPTNLVPFQSPDRSTFNGKALVVVQSSSIPGDMVLTARIKDLPVESIVVSTIAGGTM